LKQLDGGICHPWQNMAQTLISTWCIYISLFQIALLKVFRSLNIFVL
jgi:hypothetical protein